MPAPRNHPAGVRERAIRLVTEAREGDRELTLNAAASRIGRSMGVKSDTLRGWCKQAEIDAGRRPGITTAQRKRAKELEAENRELRRANEILRAASVFFARELDHPTAVATTFLEHHRDVFGVAPICAVLSEPGLRIAPSSYYAARSRPPSARARRDAELIVKIRDVFFDPDRGRGTSGTRKTWTLLKDDGIEVARCTVERLMRQEALTQGR